MNFVHRLHYPAAAARVEMAISHYEAFRLRHVGLQYKNSRCNCTERIIPPPSCLKLIARRHYDESEFDLSRARQLTTFAVNWDKAGQEERARGGKGGRCAFSGPASERCLADCRHPFPRMSCSCLLPDPKKLQKSVRTREET